MKKQPKQIAAALPDRYSCFCAKRGKSRNSPYLTNCRSQPKFAPQNKFLQNCKVGCTAKSSLISTKIAKKLLAVLVLALALSLCIFSQNCAFADTMSDLQDSVDEGMNNLDFGEVEDVAAPFLEGFSEKVKQIINGEFDSTESFFEVLGQLFSADIVSILPQLVSIFCVLVICGLVRSSSEGFISTDTEKVISFVGITVVLMSVLSLVAKVYKQVAELLTGISALTDAAMPILLTLVIANGGNAASTVCQPSMVVFSSLVINVVKNVVLPLSIFGLAFVAVSSISSNVRVTKMAGFLNSCSSWILGVLFMVFSSFTTVQGISAASIDGVSYRAAKFAAKNYIPILGGYISDGFDIVVASTTLIKNAFGVVAMLLVFLMALKPLITLVCVNLGLQAVAAVSEPIVDEKYVKVLGGISKSLTFLSALVVAVAFMFCVLALVAILCANG